MSLPRNQVIVGDALTELARLPEASVDMVLTSPAYFQLRDYQVNGQLGHEASIDEWSDNLLAVTREIRRVLTHTGTFWLNLGDTYSLHRRQGAGRKSLLMGPERLALRMVQEGWLLRNKVVWTKSNAIPTSVRDRLATRWEIVYVFAREPSYHFDLDAVRVPHKSTPPKRHRKPVRRPTGREAWRGPNGDDASGLTLMRAQGRVGHPLGKNPGDSWMLPASNYRGGHRATFPLNLAARAIQAGCPERRCTRCRAPWRRDVIRHLGGTAVRGALKAGCTCSADHEPGLVLDPFFGAGSTGVAAEQLRRDWLGIELSPTFAREARARIRQARASPKGTP